MEVEKLRVGKGRTRKPSDAEEWIKEYYELEATIKDSSELEIAKANLTGLIDGWLSVPNKPSAKVAPKDANKTQTETPSWNPSKIRWEQVEGAKGPYEKSEDVNSLDFKALLKDLQNHNGKLTRDGYFFWVFQYGTIVGRKKRNQTPATKTQ